MNMNEKRERALERAEELKGRIAEFLEIRDTIPQGRKMQNMFDEQKAKILALLGGTEEDWEDYRWQLKNRVRDVETLSKIIELTDKEKKEIAEIGKEYRWAISPYYLSLIDPKDPYDPVRLLAVPIIDEMLDTEGELDPMAEEYTNPAGSITRRYPDRLIIYTTNECAMYCRHCQRRRKIGGTDEPTNVSLIDESIAYIKANPEIRDVLLTGGDPLTLSDERLRYILEQLTAIDHLDYIRIGSRTLVTLPQRITPELIEMIREFSEIKPIFINTHFNHPQEITEDAKRAADRLAFAGVPMGNQAVLLNGINNDKYVMRVLNHELLKIRVRPYYIFHAKHVKGTTHFNTSVDDGIEIMEYLRGYTSGMAIPTYIINAPNGLGKTPILPTYLISRANDHVVIRTWEGKVMEYPNHPTVPFKVNR